jgi:hypothetical protein
MYKPNSRVSELRRPTPDYSTIDLLLDIRAIVAQPPRVERISDDFPSQ